MKVAVLQFPGSNCDQDAVWSLRDDIGVQAEYVWHGESTLTGFDAVFVPGGFSYGDYLRCGAMAGRTQIMSEVRHFAEEGRPVIGVCNGFQILCEMGLLPGALLLNEGQKFICQEVFLKSENQTSIWTRDVMGVLRIPIAHGEGRFVCDSETLDQIESEGLVAFRYVSPDGERLSAWNPNGSINDIAGVVNPAGNILGMMPHPERATKNALGGLDGKVILSALNRVNTGVTV